MPDPTDTGTLIISSLPPASLGGIDLLSFTPGPNFRGVKLLPPGFHFFFTSPTASLTLRHGIWFSVKEPSGQEPEIFVAKWDSDSEHLVPETQPSELFRWKANLGSVWNNLFTYRQKATQHAGDAETWEERGDWSLLTAHVSESLLTRILGPREDSQWGWDVTSGSSAKRDEDEIPGIKPGEGEIEKEKELRFLPIDLKQTWREGATGRERTEAARDRSWALGEMQKRCSDPMEVLGELELCFLMVLTLGNYSCLEQWKRILGLLFTCKQAVNGQPELYIQTIRVLRIQLQHGEDVEGGLFDLREDGGALLQGLLRKFRNGLEDISGIGKSDVIDELDELEAFLRSEYGWNFDDSFVKKGFAELEDGEKVELEVAGYDEDDESGEYAPTVVELTSAQKRALGEEDEDMNEEPQVRLGHEDEDDELDERDLDELDARY